MSQFFLSGGHSIGVSASASVLPMNIQDWFPLGWTGWIQGTLKSLLQHHSSKASILWRSAFFIVPLSHHDHLSLLFNMLSGLVITFLPRSKCLLISWLQSPSTMILEPKKIVSHSFPIYLPRSVPGKNTGVGCHFLLQGIFPLIQGLNPGLLH